LRVTENFVWLGRPESAIPFATGFAEETEPRIPGLALGGR